MCGTGLDLVRLSAPLVRGLFEVSEYRENNKAHYEHEDVVSYPRHSVTVLFKTLVLAGVGLGGVAVEHGGVEVVLLLPLPLPLPNVPPTRPDLPAFTAGEKGESHASMEF